MYTAKVPADAKTASIVRMLPSGNCYNAKTVTLSDDYNYYTSDGNWSSLTTMKVGDNNDSNNVDDNLSDDDHNASSTSQMITVYFSDNYRWNKVYAYTWGGSKDTASWPGTQMSYVSTNEFGESVYKVEIASDVKGLIFGNGSGAQTVDITNGITNGTGYYISGGNGKYSVGSYTYK